MITLRVATMPSAAPVFHFCVHSVREIPNGERPKTRREARALEERASTPQNVTILSLDD